MEFKEIQALISLLDDTDPEVFDHVQQRLFSLGDASLPLLEKWWEQNDNPLLQNRIETLTHKIQFNKVQSELSYWATNETDNLLRGMIIVAKYHYPELDEGDILIKIENIKREAWIAMHYDMSPTEKVKLLNDIFYNKQGFRGNTDKYKDPQNSFINVVLETRRGNQISLAVVYSIIAQKLDIPIVGVNLPQHFVLAYLDEKAYAEGREEPLFYINAFNRGFAFAHKDIDYFLRQLNITPDPSYYLPCSNLEIVKRVLRNLANAFETEENQEKVDEVKTLLNLL